MLHAAGQPVMHSALPTLLLAPTVYMIFLACMQALIKAIAVATQTVLADKKDWPDMDKREALVKQMLRRRHENWAASADNTEEHNRMKQERGKRRAEAVEKRASDQQEQKRMRLEAAAATAAVAAAMHGS